MLVAEVGNVGYRGQILAYQLTQDAGACAMQNPHPRYAHEDGIVDVIGDGVDGVSIVDGIAALVQQPQTIEQLIHIAGRLMDIHDDQLAFVCMQLKL